MASEREVFCCDIISATKERTSPASSKRSWRLLAAKDAESAICVEEVFSRETAQMANGCSQHPEVKVRRALRGDKGGVLEAASGAFRGFDYLPSVYDLVIEDPDHVYFLAEIDGEVVGFYGACLTDGGATLTLRSARVKQQFRNQHILKHILRAIYLEFASRRRPPVDVFFSMNNRSELVKKPTLQASCNVLLRRVGFGKREEWENVVMFTTETTSASLLSRCLDDERPEVTRPNAAATELDVDSFARFLSSQGELVRQYLFPENLFIIGGWHFRLTPENCEAWRKLAVLITVSDSLLPGADTQDGGDSRLVPQGVLLSCTSHRALQGAVCSTAHVFGQPDGVAIVQHVRLLVRWLAGQAARYGIPPDARILFRVSFCDTRLDVKQTFRSLGFEEKKLQAPLEKLYFQQSFKSLNAF